MQVKKSTHDEYEVEFFAPIIQSVDGKYVAVLSDNSWDRDDERASGAAIEQLGSDVGYIAGLVNHENDVLKQVAEWVNRQVVQIDKHTTLIAEPKFYKSNPNAQIIKGMLDEGAKLGISIGAIVKSYEEDIEGRRIFTELELLEASFVAIPSNKHGRVMAVAKKFNKQLNLTKNLNNQGGINVEKMFTQKDFDSALEKKTQEITVDFEKKLESQKTELEALTKQVKDATDSIEKANEQITVKDKEISTAKEDLEAQKKVALEKQKFADEGASKKLKPEDVEKSFSDGKLPVMAME